MIIDVHAHTSNRELFGFYTPKADLDFLRRQAQIFSLKKICLMATYFPLKKSGVTNEMLLERIKDDRLFAAFGSLDLENNFAQGLKELSELAQADSIVGIKLYPGYQNIILSDPKFAPIFQLAEKYNLPVACHLGELHHCCPKNQREIHNYRCQQNSCLLDKRGDLSHPNQLGLVAVNFPKVNFIACHLANPFFAELRSIMIKCPNIYTDISGQFLSETDEDTPVYQQIVVAEIKEFLKLESGPDRILFGTDFPVQSYQSTLDLVEALGIRPSLTKKLFFENATKLLNL